MALSTHAAPNETLGLLVAGGLVALIPDLDHPHGSLRRKLGCLGWVLFGWLKHRGLTHTLLAIVAVAAGAFKILPFQFGAVVTMAYVSHILADMLTVSGLPVLWPYKKDNYRLLPRRFCITTNTWPEAIIALCLVIVIGSQIPSFWPRF